jgi:hypothetical protein
MELELQYVAGEILSGGESFDLLEGEKIRIQKKVGGTWIDVLTDQTVPNNKKWLAHASVHIIQTVI